MWANERLCYVRALRVYVVRLIDFSTLGDISGLLRLEVCLCLISLCGVVEWYVCAYCAFSGGSSHVCGEEFLCLLLYFGESSHRDLVLGFVLFVRLVPTFAHIPTFVVVLPRLLPLVLRHLRRPSR